jgi:hypothetical protein
VVAESLYYSWSKEFLEAGKRRLAGDTARARDQGVKADTLKLVGPNFFVHMREKISVRHKAVFDVSSSLIGYDEPEILLSSSH